MAIYPGCVAFAAALMTCTSAFAVDEVSQFCTPGTLGLPVVKSVLNFSVKPSMVVHDDTMDVTFADAGLTNPAGEGTERLFSFKRTIGSILTSAGATNDAASREAFVGTLINSFNNDDGLLFNPASAVLVPVDDRLGEDSEGVPQGEGTLKPADLLDESNPTFAMKPLALFNRLDLAPSNWEHCGEYRIVYAIPNGGFLKRFLLIFEAKVPNPGYKAGNALVSEAGCRPMAEFWAGLEAIQEAPDKPLVNRATRLQELYYTGVEGITVVSDPALPAPDLRPIVSYKNYGGEGGLGQVRGNAFFGGGWQLREWLTQLTTDGLAFVPETVKDNPISELYNDDMSATLIGQDNIRSSIDGLHRDFIEHFGTTVHNNLFVERSKPFQERVAGLDIIDTGGVTEDDLLVTLFALGSDNKFNDFQSHSNPDPSIDEPTKTTGVQFRKMLNFLLRRPELKGASSTGQAMPRQTVDVLLARAEAGTCSGCHQTAARDGIDPAPLVVKIKADQSTVVFPDVVPGAPGFVHVDEDRVLSVALEEHFLPVRRYLMGTSLCKPLPAPPAASAPVAALEGDQFYVDEILSDALAQVSGSVVMDADSSGALDTPLDTLFALPEAARELAVEQISERTQVERAVERLKSGAFVEQRRAH